MTQDRATNVVGINEQRWCILDGRPLPPHRPRPQPLPGGRGAHERGRGVRDLPRHPLGATGGEPVCPACGCVAAYEYQTRRLFKCQACHKQFSVTSGTIFHGRKLPVRDYLLAIAIFVNAVKGISALQLGRDLDVSYKTAFVLAHKLR